MVWDETQFVHYDEQPVRKRPYSWAYSVDPVTFVPPVVGGWYPVLAEAPRPRPYSWAYSVDPIKFTPPALTFGWLTRPAEVQREKPWTWAYSVDPIIFSSVAAAGVVRGSHALMGVGI